MSNIVSIFIIISIIAVDQARTVEILSSIDPPILEFGKPATLKWTVSYSDDANKKFTSISWRHSLLESIVLANSDKGVLQERSKLSWHNIINITQNEITVFFPDLSYAHEFRFTCFASAEMTSIPVHAQSTLSITDVKGGPEIYCGDIPFNDKHVFFPGNSSFEVNLCGNPRPKLSYTVDGKTYEAKSTELNHDIRLFKYKVELKNIGPNYCGQNITFEVTGFGKMIKRTAAIVVKYTPQKINNFEYTKVIGQNCTIFKVKDTHNPDCPLTYKIQIYDVNKKPLNLSQNPFYISSRSYTNCRQDWFNNGEFAIVTPIWKHDSFKQEFVGTQSKFIKSTYKVDDGGRNGTKKTFASLTVVIPLVLGIIIIIIITIIIVFIYKHKQRDRRRGSKKPRSDDDELKTMSKEQTIGVQRPITNPGAYPLYEPGQPEDFELGKTKSIVAPRYSEVGECGGRAGPKPTLKPESIYAYAKDVDYGYNDRNVYSEPS